MTHNTREVEGLKEFYSTEGIPEEMKQGISFMRQWLNEDRKATPMVTARDLWHWIGPTLHHQLQKARQDWLLELTEGVMIGSDGNRNCYFIPCERLDRYNKEIFLSEPDCRGFKVGRDVYISELDQDKQLLTKAIQDWDTQAENLINGLDLNKK